MYGSTIFSISGKKTGAMWPNSFFSLSQITSANERTWTVYQNNKAVCDGVIYGDGIPRSYSKDNLFDGWDRPRGFLVYDDSFMAFTTVGKKYEIQRFWGISDVILTLKSFDTYGSSMLSQELQHLRQTNLFRFVFH